MLFAEKKQETIKQQGGFLLDLEISTLLFQQVRPRVPPMTWLIDSTAPYLPNKLSCYVFIIQFADKSQEELLIESYNKRRKPNCFIVKEDMLDILRVLGLIAKTGDFISFEELKSAYRQILIRTHPDKTGSDNSDDFLAVKKAKQFLVTHYSYIFDALVAENEASKICVQVDKLTPDVATLAQEQATKESVYKSSPISADETIHRENHYRLFKNVTTDISKHKIMESKNSFDMV
ncbi:MAG: hypothetical protein Q8R83_00930 [Legionellaceae bacterium]|nr:hypothetical protein [Legionellaceae bacterium]